MKNNTQSNSKSKRDSSKKPAKVRSYANERFFAERAEASKEVMRKYPLPKELITRKK